MGSERFDGSDYYQKAAAEFQAVNPENRVERAAEVGSNFDLFESSLERRRPFELPDLRGTAPPGQYGDLSASEMADQFRSFYATDQTQHPLDHDLVDHWFGKNAVTVMQDGSHMDVSEGHDTLRFAQEYNLPYLPVQFQRIKY